MKKVNKELLVLDCEGEVGSVNGYNAAVSAMGDNQVAIAAGAYSVASATGANSVAMTTGEYGRASALGKDSLAIGWGGTAKVKGVLGSYIQISDFADGNLNIRLERVDGITIMPDTWYSLVNGELRKAE